MPKIKITQTTVDGLPYPEKGQVDYSDTVLKGFGLRVGRSAKTYCAQRDIEGKTLRITIGKHGLYNANSARKEAHQLIAQMARGENPRELRKVARSETITLSEAFEGYLKARKNLRPVTIRDYCRTVSRYLKDWQNKPLASITRDMVAERHARLGSQIGGSTANGAMRVFRAIYNYAQASYEHLPDNPVRRLSQTRTWYREQRRRSFIRAHMLPAWFEAVMSLENDLGRDYLLLLLFTGMRRSEAARLRWADVDLVGKTLIVPETKNHEPLMLPLSTFLAELLSKRKELCPGGRWVFPSNSKSGHIEEPKKWVDSVEAASEVQFMLHDLRRTFITIAESLNISVYALKKLLNHKAVGDVTSGYIVLDVERLRKPMQQITDFILDATKNQNNVLTLENKRWI